MDTTETTDAASNLQLTPMSTGRAVVIDLELADFRPPEDARLAPFTAGADPVTADVWVQRCPERFGFAVGAARGGSLLGGIEKAEADAKGAIVVVVAVTVDPEFLAIRTLFRGGIVKVG